MKGSLYLIPSLLGEAAVDLSVPSSVKDLINRIDHYIVESEKSARRYLIKLGIKKSIDELKFYVCDEHTPNRDFSAFLEPLLQGKNMGIISDAGCPAIADPGAEIVLMAHYSGIRVVPLVGPSSIILALMASGLNGQKFCFHGYLPADKNDRIKKLRELERESDTKSQTQIFIETPYRNLKLLEDMLSHCNTETLLCIACDVTLGTEYIATKSVKEWKKNIPDIHKKPTVFLMYS